MELVSYRTVNIYNLENPEKCLIVIIMGFFNWLTSRNLFQIESTNLHALSTEFVSITKKMAWVQRGWRRGQNTSLS